MDTTPLSHTSPVTSSTPVDVPYSWPRALLVNMAPGAVTVLLALTVAPAARSVGLPATLGYTVAIGVVTLLEIGYLRRYALRHTGIASIRGAVSLDRRLPARRVLAWTIGFVALTVVLAGVLAPVSGAIDAAFGWLPSDLSPTLHPRDVTAYGTLAVVVALVANWILDAVVNPVVEELYWKGHLMTRLPVRAGVQPVLLGCLFATEHLWEPAEFLLVLLVQVAVSVHAWRTRSLEVAIATHVVVNTIVSLMTAVAVFS